MRGLRSLVSPQVGTQWLFILLEKAPLHASFVFSILTRKLTYPTCRCSQRNFPTGSCYLWIASTRPRSRLAVASRAAAGTTRDDAAAYVSWAALRNGRCHCWRCSDYFGSDRVSLLRDHRKGPRVDQIPNDPCSMTGSTCFALTFLTTQQNGTCEFLATVFRDFHW